VGGDQSRHQPGPGHSDRRPARRLLTAPASAVAQSCDLAELRR